MSWISGKYVRYILFAIFGLAVLHFISQSSLPLPSTADIASKFHGNTLQDSRAGSQPEPVPHDEAEEPLVASHDHDEHGPGPLLEQNPAVPERVNATFVTLARNRDVYDIAESMQHVEDRFNENYHYDWVFLNDDEFDEEFKTVTTGIASGKTFYGKIPKEHWEFPPWIDQKKAAKTRERMKQQNVIYGDSISYRHMCRYESGFFFRHELMMNYDYYWRVEPSVKYFCDIPYDPFKLMRDSKKKYSFVLSLKEYAVTVETLWNSVKTYMEKYPEYIVQGNTMDFVSSDGGDSYNLCHFWSNFEIGDLNWLRSDAYIKYFEHLDQDGGFFYERWGDAPVHSIAAALMLKKDEIHFFDEIAYWHVPFTHCPTDEKKRHELRCSCSPGQNLDWKSHSCTSRFFDINKMEKPPGAEYQKD